MAFGGTAATTRALATALCGMTAGELPADVLAEAKRAVLDWFGSALAGSVERPARMAQKIAATFGTSDQATIIGCGRASAPAASFANGVASHILELDDIHKGSTVHAGAAVIPAALAVAEREHRGGQEFLAAVAAGYEAALRIGEAVNPSHYRFWHPTGTVGTFGAAAASAKLLRLDESGMLNALGTAGTQAAGLWEFNHDGAMSKHLHPGKAAQNGMLAADLAREGFTGGSRILEGDRGFFRAMSEGFDASRISDGLGARWKILENGYKLHSCCGHTHSAIDLALRLRQDNLAAMAAELENVREINVYTYGPGFEIVRQTNPTTPYEAKFSLAYCVAAAFLEGRVGLGQFSADRFGGKGVISESHARLLTRIHVHVSDELTSKYPVAWPARIELRLGDGSGRSAGQDFPDGSPERPVSTAMLEEKFLALVGGVHGTHTAARALERVRSLELNPDVSSGFADVQPSGALR